MEQHPNPNFQPVTVEPTQTAPNPAAGSVIPQTPPQAPGTSPSEIKAEPNPTSPPTSTQNHLQIAELRDGVVILKDGTFRAVVTCRSINFDLMSTTEREGVEFSYQNFLNSLFFPIQILVQSKKVDIGPYLEKLIKIRSGQDNMLLNVLMDDYINYIDILAQEANIMEKSFYIIIPYSPAGDLQNIKEQTKGVFSRVFKKDTTSVVKVNRQVFAKAKEELQNRVNVVISGLEAVGVHSKRLETNQLSQLYYNFYNPDTAIREPLVDFSEMAQLYVQKGSGQAPPPNLIREEM